MCDGNHRLEDAVLASTHDGKGKDVEKRGAWMEKVGAIESKGCCCLGKVMNGRGHHGCYPAPSGRPANPACKLYHEKQHPWFDHAELFWFPSTREYVLTAQPYNVDLAMVEAMQAAAKELGMILWKTSIAEAWWYPGKTPLLVWRKKGQS